MLTAVTTEAGQVPPPDADPPARGGRAFSLRPAVRLEGSSRLGRTAGARCAGAREAGDATIEAARASTRAPRPSRTPARHRPCRDHGVSN